MMSTHIAYHLGTHTRDTCMKAPDTIVDKQQFLRDLAQAIREYIAKAPDAEEHSHFCLNCWQRMPNKQCAFCSSTDYSVPMLTMEQLTSLQHTLERLSRGRDPFPEDDITENSL